MNQSTEDKGAGQPTNMDSGVPPMGRSALPDFNLEGKSLLELDTMYATIINKYLLQGTSQYAEMNLEDLEQLMAINHMKIMLTRPVSKPRANGGSGRKKSTQSLDQLFDL